jgi:hypothetical protein
MRFFVAISFIVFSVCFMNKVVHAQAQQLAFDFARYTYIAPEGWITNRMKDYTLIRQSHTDEPGCIILIFPLQPSSGKLEQDARNVFDQMYGGWQFRNAGAKQYELSKGVTLHGQQYCMMSASMSKLSADGSRYDGFEDGVALVVKAEQQIVIIAARHTTMMAHLDCINKYETWKRFFNSFFVKNVVLTTPEGNTSDRIFGVWKTADGGPAVGEYIFAANGNYQFGGAIGNTISTRDERYEYLQMTTYAFEGDGSYTLKGDKLVLTRRGHDPEQIQVRFESVSHGGSAWVDRLCLIKEGPPPQGLYETCFEKAR